MSKLNFTNKIEQFKLETSVEINEELAKATRDYFVKAMDTQSWEGKEWVDGGKDYHGLEKTGKLRSDVYNSIQQTSSTGFTISVDNDYAVYVNDGTDKIPARKFFGESDELDAIYKEIIDRYIQKLFER